MHGAARQPVVLLTALLLASASAGCATGLDRLDQIARLLAVAAPGEILKFTRLSGPPQKGRWITVGWAMLSA